MSLNPGQFQLRLAWKRLALHEDDLDAPAYASTWGDEALVDRSVLAGHASMLGYTDPAYPLE
ncbi:MAG: hypothetical protein Q8O26_05040 [Phreatobacter sp.]|uniref:hypothetical protein n=1 Tax=Phreatobacter sp. TaxID=1966341 RepID=UPI00273623D0|nr:hypothetical protein [Phreatobacter sp.]MDP2801232.1 hypothetical protein [Phreatobacter sp.]